MDMQQESPLQRVLGFEVAHSPSLSAVSPPGRTTAHGMGSQTSPSQRSCSALSWQLRTSPAGSFKPDSSEQDDDDDDEEADDYWEAQDSPNSIAIPLRSDEHYKMMLHARVAANARLWNAAQPQH